jgi:hypothetical protein
LCAPWEPPVPEALARADLGAFDSRAAARIVNDRARVGRAAGDGSHGFALVLFGRQHAVLLHARLAVPDLNVAAVVRENQHGRIGAAELVPEVPQAAHERRPREDMPGDGICLDELVAMRARRCDELVAARVEAQCEHLARAEADDAPHRHLHCVGGGPPHPFPSPSRIFQPQPFLQRAPNFVSCSCENFVLVHCASSSASRLEPGR